MADPFTWMAIGSTALSAGSAVVGGIGQKQQADSDAAIATQNAGIARTNARQARLEASQAVEAQQFEARQTLGEAAAAIAQSGTGTGGSNDAVLTQSVRRSTLDALNIQYGGETKAIAGITQANQYDAEASAAKRRAKFAVINGALGVGSAALGGVANYKYGPGSAGRKGTPAVRTGTYGPSP